MAIPWGDFWPVESADSLTLYNMLIKLWKATRQRHRMLGTKYWPRQHFLFEEGTIESITDNGDGTITLADSSKTWPFSPHKRWVGWSNPVTGNTFEPASYDVVLNINADDPRDVIHITITEQLSATQIVFDRGVLDDYITAGVLGSIADLVGKEYAFMREGGLSWAKRWPRRPNDNEYEHWTISVSSTTSATDSRAIWAPDQWVGKELMCLSTEDGRLKRVTITGNSADTLTFAEQDFTPAWDEYAIINAGGVWLPNNERYRPFAWYAGVRESYGSHYPSDSRTLTQEPATSQEVSEHDELLGCVPTTYTTNVFDNDFWTGFDNECDSDHCFSPDFWKTLRAMQIIVMSLIPSFLNLDKMSDGYEGESVPMWTVAEMLYAIGQGFTLEAGAYDSDTQSVAVTATPPNASMQVFYTVVDDDGDALAQGADGTLTATSLSGGAMSETSADKTIFLSYGLPRYREKQFRYAYGKTVFIVDYAFVPIDPDIPELGNELVLVDPPEPKDPPIGAFGGIGSYQTRGKSTTSRGLDGLGMAADGSDAFDTGELYRYVGDNWNDPSITPHEKFEVTENRPDGFPPDHLYYQRFYRGLPRHALREMWFHQRQGRATSTTAYSITDVKQDWWVDWYGGGELRTESGTATSGGTTTLVDSTKIDGSFWNAASGRYVDFILEVDKDTGEVDDDDAPIIDTYKVPITAMDATTGTLTFTAADGLTVEAGDAWRIREPKYELNRWKGRTLRITKPDNDVIDVVITHSDRTTLFFDAEDEAIPAKSTYEIIELRYGAVYQWDGSKFVPPSGSDAVRLGVTEPADFHRDLFENSPTIEKLYGLYMKDDVGHFSVVMNIYRILNKLYKTWINHVWENRGEDNGKVATITAADGTTGPIVTPEEMFKLETVGSDLIGFNPPSTRRIGVLDWWNADPIDGSGFPSTWLTSGGVFAEAMTGAPGMTVFGFEQHYGLDGDFVSSSAELGGLYEYGRATGIPALLAHSAEWFVYATIDGANTDEGVSHPEAIADPEGNYGEFNFDSFGVPVQFRAWTVWEESDAEITDENATETALGKIIENPTIRTPASVSLEMGAASVVEGWFAYNKALILDWSVDDTVYLDLA